METCPHGARIVVALDHPVVFVDECGTCFRLLEETGFAGSVIPRATVSANAA